MLHRYIMSINRTESKPNLAILLLAYGGSQGHCEDQVTTGLWSQDWVKYNPRRIPQCAKGLLNSQAKQTHLSVDCELRAGHAHSCNKINVDILEHNFKYLLIFKIKEETRKNPISRGCFSLDPQVL